MSNDKDYQDKLKRKIQAYKRMFDSEDGKLVLDDLASFCGFERVSYCENAHEMYFREGRRETFLRIKAFIEFDFNKQKEKNNYVRDE